MPPGASSSTAALDSALVSQLLQDVADHVDAHPGAFALEVRKPECARRAPDRGEDHFALLPAPSSNLTDPRLELAVRLLEDVEEVVQFR